MSSGSHTSLIVSKKQISLSGNLSSMFLLYIMTVEMFWTHFTLVLLWIVWLPYMLCWLDLSDPFWYPLLTLWLGQATVFLTSSIAHLFGCKSKLYRKICFIIDYHGISSNMMGGSLACYFDEWSFGDDFKRKIYNQD